MSTVRDRVDLNDGSLQTAAGRTLLFLSVFTIGYVLGLQYLGGTLASECVTVTRLARPPWCDTLRAAATSVRVGLVVFAVSFIAGSWAVVRGGDDA